MENNQKKQMPPFVVDIDITSEKINDFIQYVHQVLDKFHQQALVSSILISHKIQNDNK